MKHLDTFSRGWSISTVLAISMMLMSNGCSTTATAPLGPLVFSGRFSGNVSEITGTIGKSRDSLSQAYAPNFHWHRADSTLDSLTGHKGKIIVLNFWATWCGPCKSEMPDLQQLSIDMKDTILLLGLSVDYPGDAYSTVKDYVASKHFTYQFVVDSAWEVYNRYELWQRNDIPHTLLIDAKGQLRYDIVGSMDLESFKAYIRKVE